MLGHVNTLAAADVADRRGVHMAGDHTRHLRVVLRAAARARPGPSAGRPISSSAPDSDRDRRMVHGQERRQLAFARELVSPAMRGAPSSEPPSCAGHGGVAGHETQRTQARRVAPRLVARPAGKVAAHHRAVVVVAREHVHRHRQRGEELAPRARTPPAVPFSLRSPLTSTASGAGSRSTTASTTAASRSAPWLPSVGRPHVQVAQLGQQEGRHGAAIVSRPGGSGRVARWPN